jgi:hypothetical protein
VRAFAGDDGSAGESAGNDRRAGERSLEREIRYTFALTSSVRDASRPRQQGSAPRETRVHNSANIAGI